MSHVALWRNYKAHCMFAKILQSDYIIGPWNSSHHSASLFLSNHRTAVSTTMYMPAIQQSS